MKNTVITQFEFVDSDKARTLSSIERSKIPPTNKIVLVTGSNGKTEDIAKELHTDLTKLWDVEIVKVNNGDVLAALMELTELIIQERLEDWSTQIILNVSGTNDCILTIAACVASRLTDATLYIPSQISDTLDTSDGPIAGVISFPPAINIKIRNLEILKGIYEGNDTYQKLMGYGRKSVRGGKKASEYQRLFRRLETLQEDGFVTRTKAGKFVQLHLTPFGAVLIELVITHEGFFKRLKF